MACITFLTDFGTSDEYAGIMKGVILSINPLASIIDLTHHIDPQDIVQAAYIIHAGYKFFPKNTVHTVVVDPGVGGTRDIIAVRFEDFFFLAPNNGVLTLFIDQDNLDEIVRVENPEYFLDKVSQTFHGRDIFAPVAAHLSSGLNINKLGKSIKQSDLVQVKLHRPFLSAQEELTGIIIGCDHFGNLMTNIRPDDFENFLQADSDNIKVSIGRHRMTGLSRSYDSRASQHPLAIIGSRGYLEIAVNQGNAMQYFGVEKGDGVRIIKS
ncbi:SAM-dependent hydroxide adenosyltransferase [Desulfonema limicola]|uniref:SAM-dependent hydroxide adenosyltransferase n=1 Tax=Desulfonema limicola TaxID=45656 RepID=A0A975GGN1_9BACT|nr:SAM-dependent chlorinase/fluorinase [Desulfonema limicola]QTA80501.1 SAM-dependent hydroxide adenosyltransferase [Desulfonema limicola]